MISLIFTKRIAIALTLFLALLSVVAVVHAQSSSTNSATENLNEVAKKYGVTFPISELGNCTNIGECRQYCEDPLHKNQCIDFAKKKGFYKQSLPANASKESILNAAKIELGCDSEASCKQFCGEQQNWEKCGEFAKKHKLSGGQVEDPSKKEILGKAKQFLGCDSYESCKGFCNKDENRQKCDEFAKLVGLRGGEQHSEGQFKGPKGLPAYENANEKARFCREFPDKCQNATSSAIMNSEQYCKIYPDRCKNAPPTTIKPADPEATCALYSKYGCSWNGTACQCSTSDGSIITYTPPPSSFPTASGNIGNSSSVKGISTVRSFLQTLLDWLRQ